MSGTWDPSDRTSRFDHATCGGPSRTIATQASSSTYKASINAPQPISRSSPITSEPSSSQSEMRFINITGPFGLNISFRTSIPGTLSIRRTSSIEASSSSSSVEASSSSSENVDVAQPEREHVIHIQADGVFVKNPILPPAPAQPTPSDEVEAQVNVAGSSKEVVSGINVSPPETTTTNLTLPRAPSPAPTEVDDPDARDIVERITNLGIKVRDFAYEPPAVKPAFITFDQQYHMAEYEYRLAQDPPSRPVRGTTLRRLLDIGWLDMAEVNARCRPQDLAALHAFDARPVHPWRPMRMPEGFKPSLAQRMQMVDDHRPMLLGMDRYLRRREDEEAWDAHEAEAVRKATKVLEKLFEERRLALMGLVPSSPSSSKKRSLHDDDAATEDDESSDGTKRRRLTPEGDTERSRASGSLTSLLVADAMDVDPAIPRQYPAHISTYDPTLYPEAAEVIASQNRPELPPRVLREYFGIVPEHLMRTSHRTAIARSLTCANF